MLRNFHNCLWVGLILWYNQAMEKEELPEQWKELIIVPIYKLGDKTDCSNYRGISLANYLQNFIQHPAAKVNSIWRRNCWGLSVWILT